MKNEIDILRDLAGKFTQGGIDYMLTGSLAMNYYAQPRMTRDIDVVVALESTDVARLTDLFTPDYYVVREAVAGAVANESMFNLIHQEALSKWIASCAKVAITGSLNSRAARRSRFGISRSGS